MFGWTQELTRTVFGMAPGDADWLRGRGLACYDGLASGDLGPPFKTKPGLALYRLMDDAGHPYFLKRSTAPPIGSRWRWLLRAVRRRRLPHVEAFNVYLAARFLADQGFGVMSVVAWGERRRFGAWPVEGVMLARGVAGDDVARLFAEPDLHQRHRLLAALGFHFARLHGKGLFFSLRMHDLFCTREQIERSADMHAVDFVMIDLDFHGRELAPGVFSWPPAAASIVQSAYLTLRTRGAEAIDAAGARAWLACYRAGVRSQGGTLPRRWISDLRARLRGALIRHHQDPALVAQFPGTPP